MSDKNGFSKSLVRVLKKMCTYVNTNYNKINFQIDDWHKRYTWSKEDVNNFRQWLLDLLKNNKSVKNELMGDNNNFEEFVTWFIFDFGWFQENLTVGDVEKQISDIAKFGRLE